MYLCSAILQEPFKRNMIMKPRTVIGVLFVVASLLKIGTLWGILHWSWFETMSEGPWVMYFCIFILLCVGIHLIIDSYRQDPDQWLQRPLPIGEDGKRIRCSVHYGGDEYVYRGETFHGARLDAFCGGIELFVPTTVNVEVKSQSFIGGVGNHATHTVDPKAPTVHIIASNFLGGVDIKN